MTDIWRQVNFQKIGSPESTIETKIQKHYAIHYANGTRINIRKTPNFHKNMRKCANDRTFGIL